MILCLYLMTLCFCLCTKMTEDYVIILVLIAVVLFWIASFIYDKTINELKSEIRNLKKKIDHIKE